LKNTYQISCEAKMFHLDVQTDGQTDRQADTHDEANRQFCILHLYLKSKFGVKVVIANISEVMFFLTVEVVGFTPDCQIMNPHHSQTTELNDNP